MYDDEMVQPMRTELKKIGVKELINREQVSSFFSDKSGTSMIFVNSVCGCSASSARPAVIKSLNNQLKPERLASVFAGVDKEATDAAREYFVGFPPSSPSLALFRGGELVHMLERHDIEGTPSEDLGNWLKIMYDKYCGKEVNESVELKSPKSMLEISPHEVKELLDEKKPFLFLDVRDELERGQASIPEATLLTDKMAEEIVAKNTNELLVIHCHHGMRSLQVVNFFKQQGIKNVKSMKGGIAAWSDEIDNSIPKY